MPTRQKRPKRRYANGPCRSCTAKGYTKTEFGGIVICLVCSGAGYVREEKRDEAQPRRDEAPW